MMESKSLLAEALSLYSLNNPESLHIRHNENMTYKIIDDNKPYVLRIHKPIEGFDVDFYGMPYGNVEIIQNEGKIIAALKNKTDLPMQTPAYGKNGRFVQSVSGGIPVTMLEWVDGQTFEEVDVTPTLLKASGAMIAKIHMLFAKKDNGKPYVRFNYDQTLLLAIKQKIKSAAQTEIITPRQERIILNAINEMHKRLDELDKIEKKHIVHADLTNSNIIIGEDGRLTPIDFSLCGYSHFYMDIAGLYAASENGLKYIIDGYKSIRECEINPRYLELYFALQIVLFVAGQYKRANEWDWFEECVERWCRETFKPLAENIEIIFK